MNDYLLRKALIEALEYLKYSGINVDYAMLDALKTLRYFQQEIETLVRRLYNANSDITTFEDAMVELIDSQLDKAWREGMEKNELDPARDMTPEMEQELEAIKLSELDHITGFAETIVEMAAADKENKTPRESLPGLITRGFSWANRYNDVMNQAVLFTAEPGNRLEWVYGDTEHCETCSALNGIVATADEWDNSGFKPQSPPNDSIVCGGWRCKCELVPTDKYRTRNRFDLWDSIRA